MTTPIKICDGVSVGAGCPLLLIAGPCQIESLDHCLMLARELKSISQRHTVNLVFKASFDKANRTAGGTPRGPGISAGLEILAEVKAQTWLPLLTDIPLPEQASAAAEVVDILQIPAFLCRQTDLIMAAAKTGKTINIKKGQFLHPSDMAPAAAKAEIVGNRKILLCERGTCFGYRDLVVDPRSFVLLGRIGYPVIFDATHSVQQMGAAGEQSGGQREFIAPLVRAAVAVGVDGLFVECHDNPPSAPSDAASMLPLSKIDELLKMACALHAAQGQL